MVTLKYIIAWLGLVVLAIMNGAIREKGYGSRMSELRAHQASSIVGIVLFGFYIWGLSTAWPLSSAGQAIFIGLIWLAMTIAFEFIFGHYVLKHPWQRLFHDYNLLAGRLWVLVLLWTALAPWVVYIITLNI